MIATGMSGRDMYEQISDDVRVRVRPVFLEEQSDPEAHRYVWAYHVQIDNLRSDRIQLLNRYWQITDGFGRVQEVRGVGVVGETPVLEAGASFDYTSGAPLTTPSGFMVGSYDMVDATGHHFEVRIPAFSLDSPYDDKKVN